MGLLFNRGAPNEKDTARQAERQLEEERRVEARIQAQQRKQDAIAERARRLRAEVALLEQRRH